MSNIEIKELAIVLKGQFNPIIFNPYWLHAKGIIDELTADASRKEQGNYINHPEVSQFSLGYCDVQVTTESMTVVSLQEGYFTHVKDLIVNIFSVLGETPIHQMGVNFAHHYKFRDEASWHKFGHTIVPKETLWNKICTNPGLLKLEIESKRNDNFRGAINIVTGFSPRIPKSLFGILVQVNDHYELYDSAEDWKSKGASSAIKILNECWKTSVHHSEKIINGIINAAS